MRLLIDIPKEFEQHFQADRFEDSLHRLSADAHLIAGLYEQETASMLIEAFATAVPVPQHGRLIDADALIEDLERQCKNVIAVQPVNVPFVPKPTTNADRIRTMSDEELAIEETSKGGCPHDCETPDDLDTDCVRCWLDWLKQEADE